MSRLKSRMKRVKYNKNEQKRVFFLKKFVQCKMFILRIRRSNGHLKCTCILDRIRRKVYLLRRAPITQLRMGNENCTHSSEIT